MKNKNMFGPRDQTFPYLNQWDSFVEVSEKLNIKIGVGCWLSSFMVNMGGSGSLRLKKTAAGISTNILYCKASATPCLLLFF